MPWLQLQQLVNKPCQCTLPFGDTIYLTALSKLASLCCSLTTGTVFPIHFKLQLSVRKQHFVWLLASFCAAGPSDGDGRKHSSKQPQGRRLSGDEHVEYDAAQLLPGEARPQLEVAPVTLYATDAALELRQFVTASATYICYGLKAGQVRCRDIQRP